MSDTDVERDPVDVKFDAMVRDAQQRALSGPQLAEEMIVIECARTDAHVRAARQAADRRASSR